MTPINILNKATIEEWFIYNQKLGKLFWKKRPSNRVCVGDEAGTIHKSPEGKYHRHVMLKGTLYYTHNLIWIIHNEFIPNGYEIDHINHKGLINKIKNLRLVTPQGNRQNLPMQCNNTSGITGVSYCKDRNKWRAQITINKHQTNLGSFKDLTMATNSRKAAEIKYGFHENHGK